MHPHLCHLQLQTDWATHHLSCCWQSQRMGRIILLTPHFTLDKVHILHLELLTIPNYYNFHWRIQRMGPPLALFLFCQEDRKRKFHLVFVHCIAELDWYLSCQRIVRDQLRRCSFDLRAQTVMNCLDTNFVQRISSYHLQLHIFGPYRDLPTHLWIIFVHFWYLYIE